MKKLKSHFILISGAAISGIAVSLFLNPNKIVNGGVSGISAILLHTLSVPPGLTFIVINSVLLLAGFKLLGMKFIIKTIYGAGLMTFFVQLFSYFPPITDDALLASLFGGVIFGIGIGMIFITGATSGGSDVLGRIFQIKFPAVSIGNLILLIDGVIILISFFIFKEIDLALVGVLGLFMTSYSIDLLIRHMNVSKIAFVITDKGEEISDVLVKTSTRGVTIIDVVGAYSEKNKKMLFCALKENETIEFQKKILKIDSEAFIVISESQRILGNGFYLYN